VILVDTSVWAEHINRAVVELARLLESGEVLSHPFVIGELAMGNLPRRQVVLADILDLPQAIVATDMEVLRLVEQNQFFGSGMGYVDAHLLAAVRLSAGASLWTFDKKLNAAARRLGVAHTE
jgi:predicted nucleic acid-binding protein